MLGFRLKRLMAITAKIRMIAATAIPTASTSPNDDAGGVEGTANCIVTCKPPNIHQFTRFVLNCVVYHT